MIDRKHVLLFVLTALLLGLLIGAWLSPKTAHSGVLTCDRHSVQVIIGWVGVEGSEPVPLYGCASTGLWA